MTSPAPKNPQAGAPAAGSPPAAKKVRRLGDYELLAKLGQGAMGVVYLARQVSLDRKVAMKILPKDLAQDSEFLERFQREARNAKRIIHPNVVVAYDIGVAENYHYIAMEYVDGKDLETELSKNGRFNEAQLLRVAEDMAGALEAAEAQGIVHRDIKPANILRNSQGVSKLTDMGLASAAKGDQRVTLAGFAVGTPYYISPEQARGVRDVDVRSDIYSLGVTLYHLATNTLPFPGNNPVVIMTQHVSETPQTARQRDPSVSVHMSALIEKMMSKEPSGRHLNASELKQDLVRCHQGQLPFVKGVAKAGVKAQAQERQAAPGLKAVAAPNKPFLERALAKIDDMLPFAPLELRLPIFAAGLTVTVLCALYFLIRFMKH